MFELYMIFDSYGNLIFHEAVNLGDFVIEAGGLLEPPATFHGVQGADVSSEASFCEYNRGIEIV